MAEKIYTLSKSAAERLPGILRAFEAGGAESAGRKTLLQLGVLELTGAWDIDSSGIFKTTAKRLFDSGAGYEAREDAEDITLYAPSFSSAPPLSAGQRCSAFYDGRWQLIGGAGGGETIYALITETVGGHLFDDDPQYDSAKPQGKVKLIGREYPENTSVQYGEPCICHELAEDDDEVLLIGTQVKVIKVDEIENEAFVDAQTTPDEPEMLTRWMAVETVGEYYAALESDLEFNGESTIKVKDSDGTEFEFTVHAVLIPAEKKVPEGTKVAVARIGTTSTNRKLVAIQHPCPANKPPQS